MSIKKNKNQLIISVLVGIAIFAVTYQFVIKQHQENLKQREEIEKLKSGIGVNYTEANEDTTVYVVAKKDLPENYTITADDVEMKDLGMKTSGVFTDIKKVVGQKTLKAVQAGFPIPKKSLDIKEKTANLTEPRPGFRAVVATVSAAKMAPFMEDNVYLDIYTADNTIQASNVRIIKILDGDSKTNKQILFEIKEEDVSPFIYAMTNDKLIPVQKNKGDKTEYSFAYDPFKYSSYTVTDEDMSAALETAGDLPPSGGEQQANYINVSSNAKKPVETVEVIQGSTKQTLDF